MEGTIFGGKFPVSDYLGGRQPITVASLLFFFSTKQNSRSKNRNVYAMPTSKHHRTDDVRSKNVTKNCQNIPITVYSWFVS